MTKFPFKIKSTQTISKPIATKCSTFVKMSFAVETFETDNYTEDRDLPLPTNNQVIHLHQFVINYLCPTPTRPLPQFIYQYSPSYRALDPATNRGIFMSDTKKF